MNMRTISSVIGSIAIAASMILGVFGPGPSSSLAGPMLGEKTGDLNMDGVANSVDALLVLFYDAGLSEPPADAALWMAAADVDCDLAVTALDASLILQADAGLYDLRP